MQHRAELLKDMTQIGTQDILDGVRISKAEDNEDEEVKKTLQYWLDGFDKSKNPTQSWGHYRTTDDQINPMLMGHENSKKRQQTNTRKFNLGSANYKLFQDSKDVLDHFEENIKNLDDEKGSIESGGPFYNASEIPEFLELIGYEPDDTIADIDKKAKDLNPNHASGHFTEAARATIVHTLTPKARKKSAEKKPKNFADDLDPKVREDYKVTMRAYEKLITKKDGTLTEEGSRLISPFSDYLVIKLKDLQKDKRLGMLDVERHKKIGDLLTNIREKLTNKDPIGTSSFIIDNFEVDQTTTPTPRKTSTRSKTIEDREKQEEKREQEEKEETTKPKYTEDDLVSYLTPISIGNLEASARRKAALERRTDLENVKATHPSQEIFDKLSDEDKEKVIEQLKEKKINASEVSNILKPYKTKEDKPKRGKVPKGQETTRQTDPDLQYAELVGAVDDHNAKRGERSNAIKDELQLLGENLKEDTPKINALVNEYNQIEGTDFNISDYQPLKETPKAEPESKEVKPESKEVKPESKEVKPESKEVKPESKESEPEEKKVEETDKKRLSDDDKDTLGNEYYDTSTGDKKGLSEKEIQELQAATKIDDAYRDLENYSNDSEENPITSEENENDAVMRQDLVDAIKDYKAQGFNMAGLSDRLGINEDDLEGIQESDNIETGFNLFLPPPTIVSDTDEILDEQGDEELNTGEGEELVDDKDKIPEADDKDIDETKVPDLNLKNPSDNVVDKTTDLDPSLFQIVDGWKENNNKNNEKVPDGLKHVLIQFPLSNEENFAQWYAQTPSGEWHPTDGFYQLDHDTFNRGLKNPEKRTQHRFNSMAANRHNLLQDATYDERGEVDPKSLEKGSEDTWNSPIHKFVRQQLKDADSEFSEYLETLEQPFKNLQPVTDEDGNKIHQHAGDAGAPLETKRFNDRYQEGYDKVNVQRAIPEYMRRTEGSGERGDNSGAISSDTLSQRINNAAHEARNAYEFEKIHPNDKLALQALHNQGNFDLINEWLPTMNAEVKLNVDPETGNININEDAFTEKNNIDPILKPTVVDPSAKQVDTTPTPTATPPVENLDKVINDNINIVSALHAMKHGDGPYDIERYKTRLKTKYETEDDLLYHISEESNTPEYKKFIDKKPPTTSPKKPTTAEKPSAKEEIPVSSADNIAREIINNVKEMPTLFNYNTQTRIVDTNNIANNETMMNRFRQLHSMFAIQGAHIDEGGKSPYVDQRKKPITRKEIETAIKNIDPTIIQKVQTDLAGINRHLPQSLQKKLIDEQGRPDYFEPSHQEDLQQSRGQSVQQEQTHKETLKNIQEQGVNHDRFNSDLHRQTQNLMPWSQAHDDNFAEEMYEKYKGAPTKTQLNEERKARGLPPGPPPARKGGGMPFLWHAGTSSWVTPEYMKVHADAGAGVPNGGLVDLMQLKDSQGNAAHIPHGIHSEKQGVMGMIHGEGKGAGVDGQFSNMSMMPAKATRDENNKITHTDNVHGFTNDSHAAHMNVLGHYAEDQIANSTENKTTMRDSSRGIVAHPQAETSALNRYSARFKAAGGLKGALARFTATVLPERLGGGFTEAQARKYSAPDFDKE